MRENVRAMGCLMPVVLVVSACVAGTMARSDSPPEGAGAAAVSSKAARPAVIDHLLGTWNGKGELFGKPAVFRMDWAALGSRFVRLEFSNAFAATAPEADPIPVLQATAIYRSGAETFDGTWFDSRGVEQPLSATSTNSALIVKWGADSAEQGRTTYAWTGPGTARVTDEVLKDGEYRVFATADYWRVDAGPSSGPNSPAP